MKVIDQILLEWSFRCPDGIVDANDPKKKAILDEILKEFNISLEEAKKNKITPSKEEKPKQLPSNLDSVENFTDFIQNKYAYPNQGIKGLDNLYKAIQSSTKKDDLLNIIKNSGDKKLTPGKTSISGIDSELFDLIMSYIKLDNGEPSELWFAIMFNGKAKGGVASEEGIESDVEVGNQGVSLKNYKKLGTIDFGALPKDELKELKIITNLFIVLTNVEFTAGLSKDSLNNLFRVLKSESFQNDLEQILELGKDTQIVSLKNIYNRIVKLLPNGNTKELVNNFVAGIDKLIKNKIEKVEWWGVIEKPNYLYLEKSSIIADKVKSKEGQLPPVVGQIKGNNLFVNGNILFGEPKEKTTAEKE